MLHRYVIDTNVLVAAFRSRNGASFRLLEALLTGRFRAFATEALLLEYRDVLKREPQLQAFWLTPYELDVVTGVLADRLVPVPIYFKWRPQLKDADDEHVLECAINALTADIVTFDRSDFLPAAERFGIAVLTPGELLRRIGLVK